MFKLFQGQKIIIIRPEWAEVSGEYKLTNIRTTWVAEEDSIVVLDDSKGVRCVKGVLGKDREILDD